MSWKNQYIEPVLDWLLEPDPPTVRYLALRDLLNRPVDDPELIQAHQAAHQQGAIPKILSHMDPAGYWERPGPGYGPKYRSSVWSLILLAQLGASIHLDERIARACEYSLDNALASGGQFSYSGAPSGTIDCLQGNLCWALTELGWQNSRMDQAYEWMARTVTGEGIAPVTDKKALLRYSAYNCGPIFACGANNKLPCAWGAAKVMLAFACLAPERRTPLIQSAIQTGVDFLFGIDPATAAYPTSEGQPPNRSWWKFGFPVFYITDLLQIAEILVCLGYGQDPHLVNLLELIRQKQDASGRWNLDYDYTGKTWGNFGVKNQPNKYVTLRALRVLQGVE
jgi:hypothetical protein